MSLFASFVHNVVLHPLLFVADVADRLGVPHVGPVLDALHDALPPDEDPPAVHLGADPEDDLPPPVQNPRTPATASLEWRPEPPTVPEPVRPQGLAGSARARLRAVRP